MHREEEKIKEETVKYKENRNNQTKKNQTQRKKKDVRTVNTRTERVATVRRKDSNIRQGARSEKQVEDAWKLQMQQPQKVEKSVQCVVIGGGAAGMMAAITAAKKGIRVILIEHTGRLGSKILQTGNGKCNFTNLNMNSSMYQNGNPAFVENVLSQFTVDDTLAFFETIGIYHKNKNGYIYPHSETAASIQEALVDEVNVLGIEVLYQCNTQTILQYENGYQIHCIYKEEKLGAQQLAKKEKRKLNEADYLQYACVITTDTLILATGSMAAPKSGSDGSGYVLAQQLKHTIRKPLPALVQLVSDDIYCKTMAGVRSTGTVSIYEAQKCIAADTGEIQYTDYGISGIPVFQVSRYAVERLAQQHEKMEAHIDMLPDFTYEQLVQSVDARIILPSEAEKTVETFFSGLLNRKLVKALLQKLQWQEMQQIKTCSREDILALLKMMKDFRIALTGYKDYAQAQVCQGGVVLEEIEAATMESKLNKHLYFAGELTDVDGKCGGYNLQWAWSSGYVAGFHASQAVKTS